MLTESSKATVSGCAAIVSRAVVVQVEETKQTRLFLGEMHSCVICPLVKPSCLFLGGGNCGWKSRAAVPLLRMKAGVAKTSEKLNSDLAECDYLEWVCIRFVCKYSINH